ncbi:hypothetical protein ACJJIX_13460 [Microbulbifer sp. VAAC004]|uniref:hypothetical protein n=1 Tax=unclassified Microbulbifer TaxID=2619833 RepID=UPI0040394A8D
MPEYHHKFQCNKCGIFVVENGSPLPPPVMEHAYYHAHNVISQFGPIYKGIAPKRRPMLHCQKYVKYIQTVPKAGSAQNLGNQAVNKVRTLARDRGGNGSNTPSMVAVMYDSVLEQWFEGSTGNGTSRGYIPNTIWNTIPAELDVDRYIFGRTCAEVDCLRRAFSQRRRSGENSQSIKNSIFAARQPNKHKGKSDRRPPCGACKAWIARAGAKAY